MDAISLFKMQSTAFKCLRSYDLHRACSKHSRPGGRTRPYTWQIIACPSPHLFDELLHLRMLPEDRGDNVVVIPWSEVKILVVAQMPDSVKKYDL